MRVERIEMLGVNNRRRIQYLLCVERGWKRVIVDFDEDGKTDFAEQESGETRWFPHTPSTTEYQLVESLATVFGWLKGGGNRREAWLCTIKTLGLKAKEFSFQEATLSFG
jgi:hypothetical protein